MLRDERTSRPRHDQLLFFLLDLPPLPTPAPIPLDPGLHIARNSHPLVRHRPLHHLQPVPTPRIPRPLLLVRQPDPREVVRPLALRVPLPVLLALVAPLERLLTGAVALVVGATGVGGRVPLEVVSPVERLGAGIALELLGRFDVEDGLAKGREKDAKGKGWELEAGLFRFSLNNGICVPAALRSARAVAESCRPPKS